MKFLIFFLFCPFLLFAQSEFVDSTAGLAFELSYTGNNFLSAYGANIRISTNGFVDFGGEFAGGTFNSSKSLVKNLALMGYVGYNFKGEKSCLKVLFGYSTIEVPYNVANGPLFSVMYSVNVSDNESFQFMPALKITYAFISQDEIESKYYFPSGTKFKQFRTFDLIFHLIKKTNIMSLIFTPYISKDLISSTDPILFGISAGIMFPIHYEKQLVWN